MTFSLVPTATTLIRMDHTHALLTMRRFHADTPPDIKRGLADTLCMALEVHATLEEEIFYPALRAVTRDNAVLAKSVPEHDEMRALIAVLRATNPAEPAYDVAFMALMQDVLHHVADEETVLLPEAEHLLADQLRPLGAQMLKRRAALVAPRSGELLVNLARATPTSKIVAIAGAVLLGALAVARWTGPTPRTQRLKLR